MPARAGAPWLLLYVLDMSFNIMTLGGMAAAVGLIIDDAIVMIEHITRRLREPAAHRQARVMRAGRVHAARSPVLRAATLVIFIPLAFLSGVTGAFFKALSLTMAVALVISFLIAWLASRFCRRPSAAPTDAEQEEGGRAVAAVRRTGYDMPS